MAYDSSLSRYRAVFSYLLRLYPRQYRQRYGESMEQTFSDLLRERAAAKRGLFACAVWMCCDTAFGIIREQINSMRIQLATYFIIGALSLLLIPFFAMQFQIQGWDWKLSDFVIMSVLLTGAGLAMATATNSAFPLRKRVIGLTIVGLLVILYVHMAVGLVDSWPLSGS